MSLHILFFNYTRLVCTPLGKYSGLPVFNNPRSDAMYVLDGAIDNTRACCRLWKTEVYSAFRLKRMDYIR